MIEILEKKESPKSLTPKAKEREEKKFKKKYGDDILIGFEMEPGEKDIMVIYRVVND